MLDTNTISYAASRRSETVLRRIVALPPDRFCVSSIAVGEIWFGLARRPEAVRLAQSTNGLIGEIEVLAWTHNTAEVYARLRDQMQRLGKALAPLDMLIAAHALEAGATLVTNDGAFGNVPGLAVEDWTAE